MEALRKLVVYFSATGTTRNTAKQLAPFTTSGGSPASGVARSEKSAAPEADWLPARRFAISDTQRDMKQWLDYLKLEKIQLKN